MPEISVFLRTFFNGATVKRAQENFTCKSPIQHVQDQIGWGSEQHALVGGWN